MYQSYHRLRPVAVSVVPLLAVSCCISRFIARGRARRCIIYSTCCVVFSGQHQRPGSAVSFVPSPTVSCCSSRSIPRGHRVSRCISRFVGCGQSWYQSVHRLTGACGQSLYSWFHLLWPVIVSVAPLQWSVVEPVVQSSQSVVPKLTFSSYIRCSIARGHSFHHSFHLSRHCFSRSIAGGQSLYQSFYCLLSVIVFVVPSLAVSSWISRFIALSQALYHISLLMVSHCISRLTVAVFKKRDQQAWRVYVTRADTQQ